MRPYAVAMFASASSGSASEKASAGAVGEVALGDDQRAGLPRDLLEALGALDEGQAHGERARGAALLDDDAPADGGARRERLAVDVDAQPHGATHSGTGSATRFSPARRTTTAQPKDTQSPS